MMKRKKYKFKISISRERYSSNDMAKICCISSKNAKKLGRSKIAFQEKEVTVSEFLEYAVQGYAFCHLFQFDENEMYWFKRKIWDPETKDVSSYSYDAYPVYKRGANKGYFKVNVKSNQFFLGTQTVFVDVDIIDKDKYASIEEYASRLTRKPTCAFYPYSDGKIRAGIELHQIRLVYVFNSILDANDFEYMSYRIYGMVVRDTGECIHSISVRRSQYIIGGDNPDTYNSSIIYSKEDFSADYNIEDYISLSVHDKVNHAPKSNAPKNIQFSEELVNDMQYMPYKNVVRKWIDKGFEYITRTPVDFGNEDYKIVTDNYVELRFIHGKLRDGQHRRKTLFVRAALRRLIKPSITADELLFNLFIDRDELFDNSDGVLSIRALMEYVKMALLTDMDSIKEMNAKSKRPTFIINPNASNKHKAVNATHTALVNKKIAEIFDTTATIKDNLVRLNQRGLKIGKSRLYEWCKENNITPVNKIVGEYNPYLSIRKNMVAMNCTKSQAEKARKEYMANSGMVDSTHLVCLPAAEDDIS